MAKEDFGGIPAQRGVGDGPASFFSCNSLGVHCSMILLILDLMFLRVHQHGSLRVWQELFSALYLDRPHLS